MKDSFIETITHGLEPVALIIRAEYDQPGIQFFTPANFSQQLAFIRHPPGHKIAAHVHNLQLRQVLYTQEVLFLRRGRVKVNRYSSDRKPIGSRVLKSGDLILLCGGGHSLEMWRNPYCGTSNTLRSVLI